MFSLFAATWVIAVVMFLRRCKRYAVLTQKRNFCHLFGCSFLRRGKSVPASTILWHDVSTAVCFSTALYGSPVRHGLDRYLWSLRHLPIFADHLFESWYANFNKGVDYFPLFHNSFDRNLPFGSRNRQFFLPVEFWCRWSTSLVWLCVPTHSTTPVVARTLENVVHVCGCARSKMDCLFCRHHIIRWLDLCSSLRIETSVFSLAVLFTLAICFAFWNVDWCVDWRFKHHRPRGYCFLLGILHRTNMDKSTGNPGCRCWLFFLQLRTSTQFQIFRNTGCRDHTLGDLGNGRCERTRILSHLVTANRNTTCRNITKWWTQTLCMWLVYNMSVFRVGLSRPLSR